MSTESAEEKQEKASIIAGKNGILFNVAESAFEITTNGDVNIFANGKGIQTKEAQEEAPAAETQEHSLSYSKDFKTYSMHGATVAIAEDRIVVSALGVVMAYTSEDDLTAAIAARNASKANESAIETVQKTEEAVVPAASETVQK